MSDEELFSKIKNPVGLRRNILESSKSIIGSLKLYYNQDILRARKLQLLNNLKSQMTEINDLMERLQSLFPEKVKIPEGAIPEMPFPKKPKDTVAAEKLEEALDDIEKKLEDLG